MKSASLELNWIARREKWLGLPRLLFLPTTEIRCGGYYLHPWPGLLKVESGLVDCSRGIIVVNLAMHEDGRELSETLAHEWRHHWQHCKGWKYDGAPSEVTDRELTVAQYMPAVRRYFTRSRSEADALRFTLAMCGARAEPHFREALKIPTRSTVYSFANEARN